MSATSIRSAWTSCRTSPACATGGLRDVLHYHYCHGHEVSDRRLGVIGGSPGRRRYAQIVRQWTTTSPRTARTPSGTSTTDCALAPAY
jgi:hypothetical protein